MVFLSKKEYHTAYNSILSSARKAISLRQANSSAATVLVLCAPDVDALCACRILVALLNADCIGYRVVPVSGWSDLSRINQEMVEDNTDLRSIVLLNLGSLVDLSEFFTLPPETCQLHVIDSHRPWNLNNVFATGPEADQIVVWDDGDVAEDLGDERIAYEALQYEPESDSDQDSDEEDSDGELPGMRRRRRIADSDDESVDSDGEPRRKGKKRQRFDEEGNEIDDDEEQPKRMSRKERKQHRSKLDRYHRAGTFYGQSVAGQMYILATLLQRTDNDTLWLAILGLTYQFTSNLIDRERYDTYVSVFANEVARLNIHGQELHQAGATGTFITGPTDRSIRPSEELRFMLFRHWNLYDSMFHSGYVAGKLRLWREKGRKNLVGLLAKMGFSLLQCQQTYAHMDMKLKRALREKVESICPEYGLDELVYGSFVRAAGYQSILSAADAVEAVGALLEAGHGVRLDFGKEDGFKTWNAYVHGEEDKENAGPVSKTNQQQKEQQQPEEEDEEEDVVKKEDIWWVQNFWSAWAALGSDCTVLRSSLQLSMALHRSVIRQGTSILDKQAIKTLRSFRLAIIKEGPDMAVFAHPATLSRLAGWLVDAVRDLIDKEKVGRKKSLPFVVACLDERKDSFMVVGINGAENFGDVRKNRFGLAFQQAAQLSGTRTVLDKFENSVIEIQKDDLSEFIEKLHLTLAERA